jgi:hypothetical protein
MFGIRLASASICLLFLSAPATPQAPRNFSGVWHQDLSRSVPPRKSAGAREMVVQQDGQSLSVKTRANASQGVRSLDLTYEIGGKALVYTGLDGDEFHSAVRWAGESLVFDIVEHERGTEITSQRVWTLDEGGNVLREVRKFEREGQAAESVAIFERERERTSSQNRGPLPHGRG